MEAPLLDVQNLSVRFQTDDGVVRAVDDVSFSLAKSTVLGIVGESGSGKSVASMTLLGLTRGQTASFDGKAVYKGTDLIALRDDELRRYRGRELSMIFQDPMTSLNPVIKIGDQIVEMIKAHESISGRAARRRAVELLSEVGIPHAEKRVDGYPHEFSGGMRQRAMIAMALACNPEVLIADEPTTALDVTIQSQIIQLIARLRDTRGASVILITHDLGVIADIADDVLVMYAGRVVERGSTRQIFYTPQHPYTWGLLGSIPRLDRPRPDKLYSIPGSPPSLIALPQGCRFRPRCAHVFEQCLEEPGLEPRGGGPGQLDRCWLDADEKKRLRGSTLAAVGGETS